MLHEFKKGPENKLLSIGHFLEVMIVARKYMQLKQMFVSPGKAMQLSLSFRA